jgi:PAS domain S-box-containing protein
MSKEINLKNSAPFVQQMEAMFQRVETLFNRVSQSTAPPLELLPVILKELGVATEVLQVAIQELRDQNKQTDTLLQAVNVQRQRFESLFQHAPEPYVVTDVEGNIQEANLAAAQLLNLLPNLLVGKLLLAFVPQAQRAVFRAALSQQQRSHSVHRWSSYLQPRDNSPIAVAIAVATVQSPEDGQTRLYWILQEMTIAEQPRDVERPNSSTSRTAEVLPNSSPPLDPSPPLADRPSQTYIRGELIPLTPQAIWHVHQGVVKLTSLTDTNEEILLGLVGSQRSFGSGASFLPVFQAVAVTDVQLLRIPAAEIKTCANIAQTLMPQFLERLQQTEALLSIAGQRRVRDRIYHFLRLLKQEIGQTTADGSRLSVRLTHEEIANACCTTRVTVTRVMGELQQQNKISIDAKSHIILHSGF